MIEQYKTYEFKDDLTYKIRKCVVISSDRLIKHSDCETVSCLHISNNDEVINHIFEINKNQLTLINEDYKEQASKIVNEFSKCKYK